MVATQEAVEALPQKFFERIKEFLSGDNARLTGELNAAAGKLTKAEADVKAALDKVAALEKEKNDVVALTKRVAELEKQAKADKDNFAAAVKEHGGKESANILAKLGIAPLPIKGEETPGAPTKTLLQEYNEAKGEARQALVAKYGTENIFRNNRKTA
jgi:hypothetical protein